MRSILSTSELECNEYVVTSEATKLALFSVWSKLWRFPLFFFVLPRHLIAVLMETVTCLVVPYGNPGTQTKTCSC